ncbi:MULTISPECIES: hypothetical protein [unclassified Ruegeria]|uniref:hypothetical protein n=1 Tax=unclassified Ruegeria TaxID=2625375 RepID=UPI0014894A2C|nr:MULTISPECIES: hypothetical protein [unclassified Ruegeria]
MKGIALDILFPDHQSAIAELRLSDTVFDEICRDYELLCDEYLALNAETGSQSFNFVCDIRETLKGLQDEIAESLRRAGKK